MNRKSRRQQILEALALMLETHPGSRITTAALARQVGVSEAALYRHFPSKARMLEGLIEFIETSLFTRISRILGSEPSARGRSRDLLTLLLSFAERNPGMSRLLVGDALQGETDRLRTRMRQLFDRLETQLRQILREGDVRGELGAGIAPASSAALFLAAAEGRINRFVRSEFKSQPTEDWDAQWALLEGSVFQPEAASATSGEPPSAHPL